MTPNLSTSNREDSKKQPLWVRAPQCKVAILGCRVDIIIGNNERLVEKNFLRFAS